MVARELIVPKAREALGTPWKHQHRLVPLGVDCAGLVLWTGRQLGIAESFEEPPAYPKESQWDGFLQYFRDHMDEIKVSDVLPGDVYIFRQHIFPCHCGIATEIGDDPKFIHAYALRKRVVEERYALEWPGLTRTAFRYRGVV